VSVLAGILSLTRANATAVERLVRLAQETVDRRWRTCEHLSKQESMGFKQAGPVSRGP
jgi:hypothetical protein